MILISELGYVAALENDGSMSPDDFQSEFNSRNEIAQPENTIWYSLITMTTIGYGDMSVSVSLSRIIIVVLSICSAIFFPLFIVTVENLLEFGYQERMSYQIFKLMGTKEDMKDVACRLMQKNLVRVKLMRQLTAGAPQPKKVRMKGNTSIDKIDGSEEDLIKDEATNDKLGNTVLDPEREKEVAFELQAVQAEIYDLSRDFNNLRMEYRNNLFTDFHTETNLVLMLLNEYMEGLIFFLEFHMKNREQNPDKYPSEKDFENYLRILSMAAKPKTMETRYYLKELVDREYLSYWHEGSKHEKEEQKYLQS